MKQLLICLFIIIHFTSCDNSIHQKNVPKAPMKKSVVSTRDKKITDSANFCLPIQSPLISSETERHMIAAGLIDIKSIDSSVVVDMKYSTCDNFLFTDVYGPFNKCYLQPDVAKKLRAAQLFLKTKYPYYSLIIYDAARPLSIQYEMWRSIEVPLKERSKYLSNPKNGSLHNFGAAVDLSIIDKNGYVLDMGTPYDYFGELAYPREEERMIKEGKLTHLQLLNRELLRTIMIQAGFTGITTEWWHFNSCYRDEAFIKYKIVE